MKPRPYRYGNQNLIYHFLLHGNANNKLIISDFFKGSCFLIGESFALGSDIDMSAVRTKGYFPHLSQVNN